ncbi:hypothetical protein [Afipia carboxidovorans]|uniref:hypothetical protein n=1 Tax=Afipia carboxidovorans TaxID=40137 RepID=UPI0030874CC7|nr:hypothetical protein CRBSH125_09690 [Afipia carboxidovorans]
MQMFAYYPEFLIAEAIDPVHGLPSECEFLPTLAKVKAFLEPRYRRHVHMVEMKERFDRARIEAPKRNPEADARMVQRLKSLSASLGSSLTDAKPKGPEAA